MNAADILVIIFSFIIILVVINNIHQLLMKGRGDGSVVKKKAKRFAEMKKAERKSESDNLDSMSREDILKEMDKLNQRIENMDVILKERKNNGN